jgi:integrase/recombinase XerD
MADVVPQTTMSPLALIPAPADTDEQLIALWVARHDSPNTRRNYQRQADRLRASVQKPLREVRLVDLHAYLVTVSGAPATRALTIAAIKSLLSFAQETGYIPFNVGKVLKTPSIKNVLAERILAEGDVLRMLALEPNLRNRAILT